MNTKIAVAVGLAAILASVFALPQAAFAADVNVSITVGATSKTTDAFSPNPVTANVGDTVIWTNDDATPHTATSGSNATPDGLFGSPETSTYILVKGKTQSHTFTEAGEFPYFCTLHPNMVGTVTVSAGGGNGNGNGGGEPTESTATATLDGNSYEVKAMSTAKATAAEIQAGQSVKVTFDKAGEVKLTLPANMIKGNLTVTAGGQPLEAEVEDETGEATTLEFEIPEGQTEVVVMGSFVVPEFPVIAALILGITVAAIVGYARFAKGSTASFFGRV
jgi:plastocyanin